MAPAGTTGGGLLGTRRAPRPIAAAGPLLAVGRAGRQAEPSGPPWPASCYAGGMVSSTSHPPYAMAARRNPGWIYGLVFLLCALVIILAFNYIVQHQYFLIHVPDFNFKLPDLHLTPNS